MFTYFYIVALVFIKSSICVGLIRIAVQRPLAIALYIVLGLSIVSGFITEVTLLNLCHPITAGWDPDHAGGFCAPMNVLVGVSYFISVMSIITDFSCSIIPSIILWKLQMKRRLKLTVSAIPSLGFLASLATIFRLQYFHSYTAKVDFLYRLTDIAAWSIVESGVGIIAGSMPALKPLIRNCSTVFGPDPTPQAYPHSEPTLHNSNRNCFMLNKLAPSQDRDHYTSKITSNRCLGDDAAESQKDILPSQGIMVREEVDVEEEYYHDGGKDPQVLVCEDFAEAKRREDPY
ncbi:hypothetical protein H2203_006451 [Taxawa tesnikishii (nom. ined.)]|nr:hypothetical protein H2203_006451 [Dothideales sp. JES 119]